MLYLPPGSAKLIRAQGALVTDQEIQHRGGLHRAAGQTELRNGNSSGSFPSTGASFGEESGIDEDEEIIQQCIEVIRSEQKASVSLMQRRLAARLYPRRAHHG
jgi:DNA segregation ATPase FtsK/SpoIIIE, S-DNA-T family